ncbi:MAG: ABC transporter permease [Christensenellales bacterium]
MENTTKNLSNTFGKRLKSMLKVDFRRTFTTPNFYIIAAVALVIPILILVMTTMMSGSGTVDPDTGEITQIDTFENVWQIIGSSSSDGGMNMSMTSMCNINMMYFLVAILVCLFVADDFRSGYAKNLFTVRSKKTDYVISKTLVGFVCGACMIIGFFAGAMLGGAMAGLSFDLGGVGAGSIIACLLSKILLVAVFVPIFVLMSVIGKQKLWLSIILSLAVSMLFFNIIPMLTPIDSTIINVILSLVGGALFGLGFGALSNVILNKTSLV